MLLTESANLSSEKDSFTFYLEKNNQKTLCTPIQHTFK